VRAKVVYGLFDWAWPYEAEVAASWLDGMLREGKGIEAWPVGVELLLPEAVHRHVALRIADGSMLLERRGRSRSTVAGR